MENHRERAAQPEDLARLFVERCNARAAEGLAEESLPSVRCGDLALTSTRSSDNTGTRVQLARRQPEGTWLRIIDRPESRG